MSRKQSVLRSANRSRKNGKRGENQGDETLYCENCGISFIWTVEEQQPLVLSTVSLANATDGNDNQTISDELRDATDDDITDNDITDDDIVEGNVSKENATKSVDGVDGQQATHQSDDIHRDGDADVLHDDTADGDASYLADRQDMIRLQSGEPPIYCPGCRELLPTSSRERGMVKWYHRRKGYGFLTRRNAPDIYVHRSALHGGTLRPGDLVEFALGENRQGPAAISVKVLAQEGDF